MKNIVVIGSGISGLSLSYYLSKYPHTNVTLLNNSNKLGGWISTIDRNGYTFETGPRTLRPSGLVGANTLDLIHSLSLSSQLHLIPKSHPAARNRFIYHNGQLQQLPTGILSLLYKNPPVLSGFIKHALLELFKQKRPSSMEDESIHQFITRRFNSDISDNLVSAIVHGIYAGDVQNLSMKSTMTSVWDLETKYGSVVWGLIKSAFNNIDISSVSSSPQSLKFIQNIQKSSSIYTFKDGLETLVSGLQKSLEQSKNVTIIPQKATSINFKPKLQVVTPLQNIDADHIICALPSFALSPLIFDTHPQLAANFSSIPFETVAVVNLIYPVSVKLPMTGFGYLVPKSESSDILGVIFDSDTLPSASNQTRLTVMMGGANFNRIFGSPDSVSKETVLNTALAALKNHLEIDTKPSDFFVSIQKDCIPQYQVGHHKTLKSIHNHIRDSNIKLSVLGSSYTGVGINDCIYQARKLSQRLMESKGIVTGLEDFQ